MQLDYSARTDTGLVRPENQDAYHADPLTGLFIVCDGMGGHNAGRLAASIAIDTVSAHIESALENGTSTNDHRSLVVGAIHEANLMIKTRAEGDRSLIGMGTTCTLALVLGNGRCMMGHVGDSRLYRIHGGEIRQLSEDHSYVQELVNCGALKPEAAATHPKRNIITRALGLGDDVSVDTFEFTVEDGDTLLLCSDGLSGYIPEASLLSACEAEPDLERGVDGLVDQAIEAGGSDNITCILIRRREA